MPRHFVYFKLGQTLIERSILAEFAAVTTRGVLEFLNPGEHVNKLVAAFGKHEWVYFYTEDTPKA